MPSADELRARFPRASADFIRRNAGETVNTATTQKRIRQRQGDGMNKWEREYAERLARLCTRGASRIHREVSLPLANGLRYKVDFLCAFVADDGAIAVEGHEVKGFARSTGIAKLKMAASVYPWIKFFLATRNKNAPSGWNIERVLP